jgi:cyclopropane fatty-acyl-phospholipid synthase-like methyltransferase
MPAREPDAGLPIVPPYFDILFSRLEAREPATTVAFGRHVHWGYWDSPDQADGSPEDYARAAEQLCRRVCDAAAIHDGLRILDVGCGFGGTIASLNERFSGLELVGVNIDARQLERARQTVRPLHGNRIRFVQGDACRLTFAPGSFDVVLAVECIFHFADRAAFFDGAARALVPGGRMALSDFVPPAEALSVLEGYAGTTDRATRHTYGRIDVLCSQERYRTLAERTGLELTGVDNISPHTLPTYPFLRKHLRTWPNPEDARLFDRATSRLEAACHTGLLHYSIVSFRKKAASLAGVA